MMKRVMSGRNEARSTWSFLVERNTLTCAFCSKKSSLLRRVWRTAPRSSGPRSALASRAALTPRQDTASLLGLKPREARGLLVGLATSPKDSRDHPMSRLCLERLERMSGPSRIISSELKNFQVSARSLPSRPSSSIGLPVAIMTRRTMRTMRKSLKGPLMRPFSASARNIMDSMLTILDQVEGKVPRRLLSANHTETTSPPLQVI
mmetsp:Transcript_60904/g.193201  ORF Transcript_60904/g.193201 Transcript_60904/m.193201 type:complete len:206 (-) Transcript_60904:343-960(-)